MAPSSLIPVDAPEYVRAGVLARWFKVSPVTVWRWVELRILPEPMRLGPRTIWFNVAEVRAALERDPQPPALQPQEGTHV